MIKFKEFTIKETKKGGILSNSEFEKVGEALLRMNNWIEKNEILVLNVETLIIPHPSSTRGVYKDTSSTSMEWYQIFRVWYQA